MPTKDPEKRRIHNRKYYENNREKWYPLNRENKRKYVERNRLFVYSYLLNHPCVDCGENDPVVLQFDHRGNKKIAIAKAVSKPYSLERLKAEISKCDVRCANCHCRKTASERRYYKADVAKFGVASDS